MAPRTGWDVQGHFRARNEDKRFCVTPVCDTHTSRVFPYTFLVPRLKLKKPVFGPKWSSRNSAIICYLWCLLIPPLHMLTFVPFDPWQDKKKNWIEGQTVIKRGQTHTHKHANPPTHTQTFCSSNPLEVADTSPWRNHQKKKYSEHQPITRLQANISGATFLWTRQKSSLSHLQFPLLAVVTSSRVTPCRWIIPKSKSTLFQVFVRIRFWTTWCSDLLPEVLKKHFMHMCTCFSPRVTNRCADRLRNTRLIIR